MTATISIDQALLDRNLLGAGLGHPRTWNRWLAVQRAAFGLPMGETDKALFAEVSGNRDPPRHRVRELWCTVGRRSGKSRQAAALAVYFACFAPRSLARGEIGTVLVLAASREQATTVTSYAQGFLEASPLLKQEIDVVTQSEIRLRSGVVIMVHPNSYRTVRGKTLLACIFDEVAVWRDAESALPDIETYRAILPSLLTTRGMLVGISSPYRKTGLLFQKHKDFFGQSSDDVLVVQGASRTFNPTLDEALIAAASADDPEAAAAEWHGEFRTDVSSFLDDETLDRAVDHDRPLELPPRPNITYKAFIDPSGGRFDAYTICVAHREDRFIIVDAVRAFTPPFNPAFVTDELARLVREYHCYEVRGDNYAGEWVAAEWQKAGVRYARSEKPKSQLYVEALPLFARGVVKLPNHAKLLRELRLLERRVRRSGKDSIDHGPASHDDLANSVCGALVMLSAEGSYLERISRAFALDDPDDGRSQADRRLAAIYSSFAMRGRF